MPRLKSGRDALLLAHLMLDPMAQKGLDTVSTYRTCRAVKNCVGEYQRAAQRILTSIHTALISTSRTISSSTTAISFTCVFVMYPKTLYSSIGHSSPRNISPPELLPLFAIMPEKQESKAGF